MNGLPDNRVNRLLEILPGLTSWLILLGPVLLSFRYPRAVAIFMVLYVTLWFLRSMKFNFYLIYAVFKSRRREKKDWLAELEKLPDHKKIFHVVILTSYNEPIEILESSISAVQNSNFPLDKIFFVLATEERQKEYAEKIAQSLSEKYGNTFAGFFHFMHPMNLPDEIPGKGSNIHCAGKKIAEEIKKLGINPANVLVTTLDADNRVHQNYFAVLTYNYLSADDRKHKSYQPLPLFYNNIWEVPMWSRLSSLASSFWHLSQAAQIHNLRNFSAHAQSLDALIETDFWAVQTIVEDGQQFWRSYFAFSGNHEVIPLFIPVYQDAVQNKTYLSTLKGQYVQLRRWAWGASDIPYVIFKIWELRKKLPLLKSIVLCLQLFETHIMWATAPIVITLTNSIPQMLNREFAQTVFVYNLSRILSVYFTVALVGIIISLWISLITLPRHPRGLYFRLISLVQWIFIPFVTIFFGALPAIDAQTRLMLRKYLGFQVTEKVRRRSEAPCHRERL